MIRERTFSIVGFVAPIDRVMLPLPIDRMMLGLPLVPEPDEDDPHPRIAIAHGWLPPLPDEDDEGEDE